MKLIDKISNILEVLPYLNKHFGKIFVIKYGGSTMLSEKLSLLFAQNIVFLKNSGIFPIIVHGGGPEINRFVTTLNLSTKFIEGRRITDEKTMEIVEMVLSGKINKKIVSQIQKNNGKAVGICGKDGGLTKARKIELHIEKEGKKELVDIGLVGEITKVDPEIIFSLQKESYIPVISPISESKEGQTLNINADSFAGKIASSLNAEKLILLTDTQGVLINEELISILNKKEAKDYIKKKKISGGMIPKVLCCINALENGVKNTHIIDGREYHSLLLEIFTDQGSGTLIRL